MHSSTSCISPLHTPSGLVRTDSQLSRFMMDGKRGFFSGLKKALSTDKHSTSSQAPRSLGTSHHQPRRTRDAPRDTISGASRSNRRQQQQERDPENDPPPAYTPPDNTSAGAVNSGVSIVPDARPRTDDRYAFLSSFDTVFLIDDSGSMAGRSWRETGKALEAITPICVAHDADGVDVHFLNEPDKPFYHNIQHASTVRELFQTTRPRGYTPTGQRINQILKPYVAQYTQNPEGTKPLNLIVITDGEPSDDVESPIISAAKKLDKLDAPAWQVGIQFFQVGSEPGAREHLETLDDNLKDLAGGPLRDMVDTVPWTGEDGTELTADGILKVVLGAVNRRLDRKKVSLHKKPSRR